METNDEMNKKDLQLIIDYLKTLPPGTEISLSEICFKLFLKPEQPLEEAERHFVSYIDVMEMAEKEGILLDKSKYADRCVGLPENIPFRVYQKKAGKKCPHCRSIDTANILYGMPAFSEELENDLANHRIALGGCCISECDPQYHCYSCGKDFGTPPIFFSKKGMESYPDEVIEIHFDMGDLWRDRFAVTATKTDDHYRLSVLTFSEKKEEYRRDMTEQEWKTLISRLYGDFFVHEWKKKYSRHKTDGEPWALEIKLTGKRVRNIHGTYKIPPYLKELVETFEKLKETR